MHAPAVLRALKPPTVSLAARIPARGAACRAFHATAGRRATHGGSGSGSSGGGKPADDSATEHDSDAEPQTGTETSGGRTRTHAAGPSRTRHSRRHVASVLHPVQLPSSFLDSNVSIFDPRAQPRLPIALQEDARHDKVSRLFSAQGPSSPKTYRALESYFETALNALLLRNCELAMDFMRTGMRGSNDSWSRPIQIERVVRIWDMILDAAWHLADALYPARQAEYTYKKRPFWWWHIYRDFDSRTLEFRDQFTTLPAPFTTQLIHFENLDFPLPHAVADLHADTLFSMQQFIAHDLLAPAPPTFDSKTSKRPIPVLSLSGYGGRAIAEAVGEHIAFFNGANLIRLDAYDLSVLVGDYLGQNWAYSRGAVSMMGFRAAELNGKLHPERGDAARNSEDEDGDAETSVIRIRATPPGLEEDLQKTKQGAYDCFTKWDSLKIDKILDHIIHAASLKSQPDNRSPVLIHVHDLVELGMTLEGSLLLGKLRALVDAAWQQGAKIAILGTSSCELPSEEYENAIQDLAAGDFVITRHIQPNRAETQTNTDQGGAPFSLQEVDYFVENLQNVHRMLRAMDPESQRPPFDLSDDKVRSYLHSLHPRFSMLRKSVLPIPEIYTLASAYRSYESTFQSPGSKGLILRFILGPLRQKPGQLHLDEEEPAENNGESGEARKGAEEAKAEPRVSMKLNDYEKRIAGGQINRENLRTTFADVHAPPETISALKLLTSLALVRPDAFSYGVLAQDRIPGCLLYGPPGTGKTMLAKAVAKESGANMLELSGATINDKWVGESEKLIRAVFTLAKRLSPCVVFIDEADSLLANRSLFSNRASHREHINQFLKEWDGMEETKAFIMVATNRPQDLDNAVLRRLPRKILVDLPLKDDRAAILRLLLRGETLDGSVSLEELAGRTNYYSGSDLKNVCVAAAMAAVEEENEAAAKHSGPEPFRYPERRVLRKDHFERGLKQIPSSISEDMASLKMIRKFDEEYGDRRKGAKKSVMGFGILHDEKQVAGTGEARVRQGSHL